jgi:S1-C subfamily serine protease
VAGERTTGVIRDDGQRFDGQVVAFDPARDLAVIRVSAFDRPALRITSSSVPDGTTGGVFGHPGGEPLRIAPFQVSRTINATGLDIYGGARTERKVLELAATLRPGDSGSALADSDGTIVGIAFAIARDRADVSYALAPSEIQAVLDSASVTPVGTGPCLG